MPVFRVQVNYRFGLTGKWSNVWHISGATLTDGADVFLATAVPALRTLLHPDCLMVSLLVSDEAGPTFITAPVNAFGTSSDSGELLPLFNSVKALFADGSLGRPDYKYLKGIVTEGGQIDGDVAAALKLAVEGTLGTLLGDMEVAGFPLVSADNDQYVSVSAQPAVQMRQMHRKRRRTPTP
jgi:hypothetical protein